MEFALASCIGRTEGDVRGGDMPGGGGCNGVVELKVGGLANWSRLCVRKVVGVW